MARKIVDNHRTRMPRPPITDHSGADPRRSPLAPSDPSLADPRPPPRHGQFIHQHVQRDACTSSRGRAASLTLIRGSRSGPRAAGGAGRGRARPHASGLPAARQQG